MKLDEKYRGNYESGIFFTESEIKDEHQVLKKIKSDSKMMNANLGIVKSKMASKAKHLGANAIMNFKYGQKRTLLSIWDDTKWYAEGVAIKLEI